MNEQSKIHALCFNTKTGQIYIYPKGFEYKKFILRSDNLGYFFKMNGIIERITNEEEIERVKNYINH